MAPTDYALIGTEIGSERSVLEKLKEVEGVKKATLVYNTNGSGVDIVASVYEPTMEKLKEAKDKIKRIDKVTAFKPLILVEGDDSAFSRNEKGEVEKFKL